MQLIQDITALAVTETSSLTPLDAWQLVQAHMRLAALLEGPVDSTANRLVTAGDNLVDVDLLPSAHHPAQNPGHEHSTGCKESVHKALVAPRQLLLSPTVLKSVLVRCQSGSKAVQTLAQLAVSAPLEMRSCSNSSARCRVIVQCF